jgi:3-oxoacyl-[acyl-carrier protein] reductase
MDLGLRGRVALVMASTSGLGAATAAALAAEGARVVITGRSGARAAVVADGLPGAVPIAADISEPAGVHLLLEETVSRLGDPDIVVLNGPGPSPSSASDMTPKEAAQAMDLLLMPQLEVLNRTVPAMRGRGWGRVLAIGSGGVEAPIPMLAASNVGRAALSAYLKTLAGEVAPDGVTVNMLLPGRMATARVESLDAAAAERSGQPVQEVRAQSERALPAGRYGAADEFGAVAAFLCSRQAAYVTGSRVRCDGGMLQNL